MLNHGFMTLSILGHGPMWLCPCGSEGRDKIEHGEASTSITVEEMKSTSSLPPRSEGAHYLYAFHLFSR
jgi:hypothetical protein